jgi:hypothetical protein
MFIKFVKLWRMVSYSFRSYIYIYIYWYILIKWNSFTMCIESD